MLDFEMIGRECWQLMMTMEKTGGIIFLIYWIKKERCPRQNEVVQCCSWVFEKHEVNEATFVNRGQITYKNWVFFSMLMTISKVTSNKSCEFL